MYSVLYSEKNIPLGEKKIILSRLNGYKKPFAFQDQIKLLLILYGFRENDTPKYKIINTQIRRSVDCICCRNCCRSQNNKGSLATSFVYHTEWGYVKTFDVLTVLWL